jgi:small subunit ribosomal protein S20
MAQMVKLDFQSLSTEITIRFFTEVDKMANIKSAKKRILVNQTKYERNKAVKSAVKTAIKKVEAAILNGSKENAAEAFKTAESHLMKAVSKGVFKKNTASRKISRLSQKIKSL